MGIAFHVRLRGLGECHKLLQRGLGQSPRRKWILRVLSSTEHISDRQKRQNDQLHFNCLSWNTLTLNRDKFGTIQRSK